MQGHYNAARTEPSIPEDDGRSLLAIDQYRLEMSKIRRLDVLEERRVADLARSGDKDAKGLLIESLLGYVYGIALQYASKRNVDVMDLIQAGNEAVVRHLDEALKCRNACAFLCVVARYAIISYFIEDSIIRVPVGSFGGGSRAPLTVSLLSPLTSDNTFSLVDIIPDNSQTSAPVASPRVRALNGAIRRLPSRQRAAVRRRAGLPGYGVHSLEEMTHALKSSERAVHGLDYRARQALRSDVLLCKAVGVEVAQ
jgi:RNA polymerase sigma factor (sigma-70 family)